MSKLMPVTFYLNGKETTYLVAPETNLLRMLRDNGNYDVKCSCEEGDCGSCTVIINGEAIKSCITLAPQVEGACVTTTKGVTYGDDELGHLIQRAFVECGSIQCGFCTPGMVMAAKDYLEHGGIADRAEIRRAISGNLCRCTGYVKIVDAIYLVAEQLGREVR